jgi:hypothetical protein
VFGNEVGERIGRPHRGVWSLRRAEINAPNALLRAAALNQIQRRRRSSTSDTMNPNAGQPPDAIDRSNHARACATSPRTRYQFPSP